MTKEQVRNIVRETVQELIRSGVIGKNDDSTAYNEIVGLLRDYYKDGETDRAITSALQSVEADSYFRIIPLYFSEHYTNERLAEFFNVEVSTISRNKRRICLAVYDALQ